MRTQRISKHRLHYCKTKVDPKFAFSPLNESMGQFELVQNRDHKEYQVYTHYTMIQTDPNSKHPLEKPIAYNPHLLFSNLVSNLYV